jgi:TolB-like protein/DNA-binding winged helix-turn-helix (wHTH) protein
MVDVQADAASKAGASPLDEARGAFAFAGLVLDLDACTLNRESGEAIALTRGEFALLREFVRRPGRVLSRDFLLDAAVGRRNAPFDRSVDVMVGRLRKKVEPDPKQPSVIQTVPGEGYRFSTPLCPHEPAAEIIAATTAASPGDTAIQPPAANPRTWRAPWPVLAAVVLVAALFAAGGYVWRSSLTSLFMGTAAEDKLAAAPRLSIVVLPFENMSGDKEQDYFADGITDDLTTDLSHLQDSFVISRGTAFTYKGKPIGAKQIGRELGVRYVLEGSVRRLGEKVEVNAQLISTESGAHVWADRFEGERSKLGELQLEVVSRLTNSLGVELVKAEALRSMRERPNNPDAVDLAMRATAKAISGVSAKSTNGEVIASASALRLSTRKMSGRWSSWRMRCLFACSCSGATTPKATPRVQRNSLTPLWSFGQMMRGRIWRSRMFLSPSGNGERRSRRSKPRLRSIPTTRAPMRAPATIECFSAAARKASPALKPRFG